MSLIEHNTIDHIVYSDKENLVTLTLIESRDWGGEGKLLPDLQEKLNTYINYVDEGLLYKEYPRTKGGKIAFRLFYKYKPGIEENNFINIVKKEYLEPKNIIWIESIIPTE